MFYSLGQIYTVIVTTFVLYGSETWAMNEKDMNGLGTWERNILIEGSMEFWWSKE
jgi:hypothetical protein